MAYDLPIENKFKQLLSGEDFSESLFLVTCVIINSIIEYKIAEIKGTNENTNKFTQAVTINFIQKIDSTLPCNDISKASLIMIGLYILEYIIRDFDSYPYFIKKIVTPHLKVSKNHIEKYVDSIQKMHQSNVSKDTIKKLAHDVIQYSISKEYPLYPQLQLIRWFLPINIYQINASNYQLDPFIPEKSENYTNLKFIHRGDIGGEQKIQYDVTYNTINTPFSIHISGFSVYLHNLIHHELRQYSEKLKIQTLDEKQKLHPLFYLLKALNYRIEITQNSIDRYIYIPQIPK